MKSILLATLATTVLCASAHAGSISLDSRADFEVNQYNDAAKASAAAPRDNHRFNLQTLRVDFKGNFNEDTTYRLRYRLNSGTNSSQTNARDSLNSSVDFAYIQHRWFENFQTQFGKFTIDIGGIEGLTSGPDLYFKSLAYAEEDVTRYSTGMKAIYTVADQEFSLLATNQQTDADLNGPAPATGGFNQNREAVGFVYKGSFLEKSLLPVLSVHQDNVQSISLVAPDALDKKFTYYSAGFKYDMVSIFFELDYLYNTYENRRIENETDKTTSIVGTIGYRIDNWVFKVKGEGSETETFTAANTSTKPKQNTYAAAVEYLPTNDKHFRYHLAYVSRDIKPESADTQNSQQVIAGVRLFADFLK